MYRQKELKTQNNEIHPSTKWSWWDDLHNHLRSGMVLNGELSAFNVWREAAADAMHLMNVSPFCPVNFKIWENFWPGKCPKFDRLKTLGFSAYTHQCEDKLEHTVIERVLWYCQWKWNCRSGWTYEYLSRKLI